MVLDDPGFPIFVAFSATWLQQANVPTEKISQTWVFQPFLWVPVLISFMSIQGSKAGKKTGPSWSWPKRKGQICCGGGPKKSWAEEVHDRSSIRWPYDKHRKRQHKGTDTKTKEGKTPQNGKNNSKRQGKTWKILEGQKGCRTESETAVKEMPKNCKSKIEYQKRDPKQDKIGQKMMKMEKIQKRTTRIGTRWRNWRVRERLKNKETKPIKRTNWQCKYLMSLMSFICSCPEASHFRQTIKVPGLDLKREGMV